MRAPAAADCAARRCRSLLAALPLVLIAACGSAGTDQKPQAQPTIGSASQLVDQMTTAVGGASPFVYEETEQLGGYKEEISGQAGQDEGDLEFSLGPLTFHVLAVDNSVFVEGPAVLLQENLGLTPGQAASASGKWIMIDSSDPPFEPLDKMVTAGDVVAQFTPTPGSTTLSGTGRVDGKAVYVVTGTNSGTVALGGAGAVSPSTTVGSSLPLVPTSSSIPVTQAQLVLDLSRSGPPLPIQAHEALQTAGHQLQIFISFSDWGEALSINPPSDSVTFASIG